MQQRMVATHRLESKKTGVITKLETQQSRAATHTLDGPGQIKSASLQCSKSKPPLTF